MMTRHYPMAMMLSLALGCATAQMSGPVELGEAVRTYEPVYGPGTVFETIDEAAIDGLAWCYLESRGETLGRVRGGSVRPVEKGGYTYEVIATARENKPEKVWIVVEPNDVAYFIHVPGPHLLSNESHSRVHRANVDELDPLHRPSYLLTPHLRVQVYAGEGDEHRVAILDRRELRELVRRADRRQR